LRLALSTNPADTKFAEYESDRRMLLRHLRRVTRDGNWIPEIDGLRFLAITSVILFHMLGEMTGRIGPVEPNYAWLERLLANGFRGVSLFFVISGMILALPFARQFLLGAKPVSLRKYYMRRVTRLEPPYIAAMLLVVFLIVVYRHSLPHAFAPHLLASLFYQHSMIYGQRSSINGVTWSLEVEIQFYVLAPLAVQVYRIRRTAIRRVVLLLGILGISLLQMPFHTSPRFELSILFYLHYFLMGILVADIFVLDLPNMRSSWLWDLAGIVALAAIFWTTHEASWAHAVMPFALSVVCIAAMRSYGLRRLCANQWIAVIGGMCYSIYLLHSILMIVMFKVTRKAFVTGVPFFANYGIQLLLVMVPVLAMCAVFFVLIERPCMDPNWPSKLWQSVTRRGQTELETVDVIGVAD
jgi:peptidoglycan/LPS O-acetylase OafA/YrhL